MESNFVLLGYSFQEDEINKGRRGMHANFTGKVLVQIVFANQRCRKGLENFSFSFSSSSRFLNYNKQHCFGSSCRPVTVAVASATLLPFVWESFASPEVKRESLKKKKMREEQVEDGHCRRQTA
ncbi:hypothetical protein OIU84_011266 [Salix udensis]|uniref:Uncharacterized protein n=1 Tax=Salix udensis TaxID=889485 RepID=A0AAD6NWS6_9ROSI|nr:hypothetical protein OIU84_011266 [Salix udensis]